MYLKANFSNQERETKKALTENKYLLLCKLCDKILLDSKSNIQTNSISWLHVIREHPVVLKHYFDLFERNSILWNFIDLIKRKLLNIAGLLIIFVTSIFKRKHFFNFFKSKIKKIDILYISHFLNKSQVGNKDDFYFGNIPDNLKNMGYNSLIALINHTGNESDSLSAIWNKKNFVPRIILSRTINFFDEMKIFISLKKESIRLKKLAKKEKSTLKRNILFRSSEECITSRSMINLRIAFQINKLVSRFKPKVLIITHEGHAFERVIFANARQANSNIYCIGYQHAIIFRLQNSVFLKLKDKFNPNEILTSGITGKNKLEEAKTLKNIPIKILGSNRFMKKKSLLKFRKERKINYKKNKKSILVIPEGLISECYTLFDFSLKCAYKFPKISFIWRLHPGIDFDSQINNNYRYKSLPKNIIVSKKSLEEDFNKCDWALYRGTTAIIQAMLFGLKPIYLELPNEFNIDPLDKINNWKVKIKNIDDFKKVMNEKSKMWSEKKWLLSKNYCNRFFKPFDIKVLLKIIKKIDSKYNG